MGSPLALEILGRPFSEATLIRIAAVYERARGPRVLPTTTPRLAGEAVRYRKCRRRCQCGACPFLYERDDGEVGI